jgi:glycosyltransferase involved in cell wall biosynthesis
MEVSIVIPTFNAEKTIGKTLEACLRQDHKGQVEVIVVDDGSTDGTKEEVEKFPVKYIYQENAGPASARNRGWRESRGEFVCFTDSDCIPSRDWVSKLVGHYRLDGNVGAVGGSYTVANPESLLAYCIQEEISIRHSAMPKEVRFLGSYNLSVKRTVLEEIGGFQEGYKKASGEDNDLSYKILKHGHKILFDREALVAHYHRESLWRYLNDQYTHGFWRARLYREHPDMGLGDDYTRWKDILEVPLCLGLLATTPFLWVSSGFSMPTTGLWEVCLGLLFILQLGMAFKISSNSKRPLCLTYAFVTFLRCFARSLGFLRGLAALGMGG